MTRTQINRLSTLAIAAMIFIFSSCTKQEGKYGIFQLVDDTTVEMNGTIGSSTLRHFNNMMEDNPNISLINMKEVPGSKDDETNLKVSKRVHDLGISIHLLDGAEIASGGVDFFLAGVERSRGTDTKIGVHSWGAGNESATDFPKGHENHLPYINYYVSVGLSQQEAEDFYYFTIYAAPAESIHWMTDEEVEQYKLLTK